MPWPCVVPVGLRLRLIRKEIRGTRARLGRCYSVRVGRIRLTTLGLVLGRKFTDMMTLAGAAENQYAGGQRETGSAKKNSHNASDSKRRALEGARRKAGEGRRQDAVVNPRRGALQGGRFRTARLLTALCKQPLLVSRNEIERALRRITVSRSGSNYQEYGVERSLRASPPRLGHAAVPRSDFVRSARFALLGPF